MIKLKNLIPEIKIHSNVSFTVLMNNIILRNKLIDEIPDLNFYGLKDKIKDEEPTKINNTLYSYRTTDYEGNDYELVIASEPQDYDVWSYNIINNHPYNEDPGIDPGDEYCWVPIKFNNLQLYWGRV